MQDKIMKENVIFSSENVLVIEKEDGYYIQSFKKGMSIDQFNKLMLEHPEINITSIMTIRNSLVNAPRPPEKFAEAKERVSVELSEDELRAYVTLNIREEELSGMHRSDLFTEILRKLNEKGITYGIKNDVILNKMEGNVKTLVAEGTAPVNGKDADIRMYELKEIKPEAKEDGNVDHYELNLINRVSVGDWLGERIEPEEGISGRTVKGSIICPVKGKDLPLSYDKKTVKEVHKNDKTVLYALINGAVHFEGDRISVSNHLEMQGNIDFRTGNIDFDGYLTIKGTIEDGFSVSAQKDIEILGDIGVGGVKDITSKEGSIYIKSGIAGHNKAVIRSKKNIYTKFVSDTTINCEGSVHIGFYCLNSNIRAKEVILDSSRGQIIGGNIEAQIRVVSSTIGSVGEKRTNIIVSGFNRNSMKKSLDNITCEIEKLRGALEKAKLEVSAYSNSDGFTREQMKIYDEIKNRYYNIRDNLKKLEEERKALTGYLRTHGEGEVSILKKGYPNTHMEIKGKVREIIVPILSSSFFVQDGELKEI